MKTGLLTILAVAISAVLCAGSLHASEPSNSEADAAALADGRVGAQPEAPAPAPRAAEPAEGAETGPAERAEAGEAAADAPLVVGDQAGPGEVDAQTAASPEAGVDSPLPGADGEIGGPPAAADSAAAPAGEPASQGAEPARKVSLGKIGYDAQGRPGRIHVVVTGDTLWDISDAYLGTPWVWPSVWTDNREIENPHLIVPGDRIWISAHEMRRVSAEEAERLLAGQPRATDGEGASAGPASDSFQSLFQDEGVANTVRVSSRESSGLISSEQLEAAASIVDAVPERVLLSQGDRVYIGLGEDDASVGDQFTIFRTKEKVFDPDSSRLLGYHVELLGWVEVLETDAEASLALIRMSATEMELGDRVMPREPPLLDIEVAASPKNVDGLISFFPSSRVLMGSADYVYLNRGEIDGLEIGSPLEVYRSGWLAPETARDTRVEVPDRVIARLLVVRARRESAVAVVRHTETELQLGDRFRGAME